MEQSSTPSNKGLGKALSGERTIGVEDEVIEQSSTATDGKSNTGLTKDGIIGVGEEWLIISRYGLDTYYIVRVETL